MKIQNKLRAKKAMESMFGNPVEEFENMMTDMFGSRGAEEIKECYEQI